MKTFNKYMIAALFSTTSVLAFSSLAGAAPANTGTGNGTGGCQLAPAQQNIYNEHLKVIAPLQQQILAKQAEISAQYAGDKPDAGRIQALTADLGTLNAKMYAEQSALHAQLVKSGMPNSMGYGMMNGGMIGYGMMNGGMGGNGMMNGGNGGNGMMNGYRS